MPYLCMECGNDDRFDASRTYTETGTEDLRLNRDGDVDDVVDSNQDDYDTEDIEDISCNSCNSDDVRWFNDEDELEEERRRILGEDDEEESEEPEINWRKRIGENNA